MAASSEPNANVPQTVICVFCGASPGMTPEHLEAARTLASVLHKNNISLVYGGGTAGLMGEVARTLVSLSGPASVHGIIPGALVKHERSPDVSNYGKTTIVPDMHTRKRLMAQEVMAGGPGSGFVALSGGYGTLEELMEVATWNQLGIHDRGIVVLNVGGFWDGLFKWVGGAVEAGFVREGNKEIMLEAKTAEEAVGMLRDYKVSEERLGLNWEKS